MLQVIKRYRKLLTVYIANLILTGSTYYYYMASHGVMPSTIPFFYTLPWSQLVLSPRENILILFVFSIVISTLGYILSIRELALSNYSLTRVYSVTTTISNLILIFFIFRIINVVSITEPQIPREFKLLIFPAAFAFITTMLVTPLVIKLAYKLKFIDDPLSHKHPGMLITKPTPRAGGLAFLIGILIPSIVFLPIFSSQKLIGIFTGSIIATVTGLFDDRKDIPPVIRLVIQLLLVLIVALAGVILIYIPNPFAGPLKLDDYKFVINFLGEHKVHYFSVIAACLWMGWVMNFMSWANGTDGVYAGLVSISAATIAILMYLNSVVDPGLVNYAVLAAFVAGSGLAMSIFTWPPMKMMWGFGATAPALIIAALSILGSTKVAVTVLVLMIPFLDAVFAIVRRVSRGQMPFYGDREHLHHKLLDIGWSKQKIAIFYWLTTLSLAVIGLITKGQTRALTFISIGLIVVAGITLLNFIKIRKSGKKTT